MVRVVGLEPTRLTAEEPKSSESTISTIPAYMSDSAFCRYFVVLCFYTARDRGGAKRLTRSYKNRRACFYRRMSAARMAQKPFTKVTSPKSIVSANSTTGAYTGELRRKRPPVA